MKIYFPYHNVESLDIPESYRVQTFSPPCRSIQVEGLKAVKKAIKRPIGTDRLRKIAKGKRKVLILVDDVTRPTPAQYFLPLVLSELHGAGVKAERIEFMIALGTHRPMTEKEIAQKIGRKVANKYKVHNHNWKDTDRLIYLGDTEHQVPIWVNKRVTQADLVIGVGAIMPIDICGFTGGGKIVIPGICGQITVDDMHWKRISLSARQILGKEDNPVRASIDSMAKKSGLDFIINVILDTENRIIEAVAGDLVEAHRFGCGIAKDVYGVNVPREFDIVIGSSFPFDNEFWQANKALDTMGMFVRKGGAIILVSPCNEGFSCSYPEVLEYGYLPTKKIINLVNKGELKHKVVGVHMYQVSTVAVEKAKLILVSTGILESEAKRVGFMWARSPQEAFRMALQMVGNNPEIAVLKNASRILSFKY
jgi:nickel-dependent lactate racemase